MQRTTLFLLLLLAAAPAAAMEGTGLQTSIAVDMTGSYKVGKDSPATDKFQIREAEAMFYAPIDHLFDGVFAIAAHNEGGVYHLEVHEASISTSKLVPRSNIKVGQFFLGIGRLGRVHRHDWPFITTPKSHATFFDQENISDSGLEYNYVLPTSLYLDVTAGVTNGWVYGHAHTEGEKPRQPTNYSRVSTYTGLPSNGGLQLGLNYLGRRAADGGRMTLVGLDSAAKWREEKHVSFLFQWELWHRQLTPMIGEKDKALGGYFYPQYGISQQTAFGVRYDYFTTLTLEDALGEKVKNSQQAIVPTFTYKASEFSTLRLAYTHDVTKLDGEKDKIQRSVETQAMFIIGAHPAHDF